MSRLSSRAGFTLLEMLLALAIMAVLAGSLYTALYTAFRAEARAQATVEPMRGLTLAVDMVGHDLAAAVPATGVLAGTFTATNAPGQGGVQDADTLAFCLLLHDPDRGDPGIRRLEFALTSPEAGAANLVRDTTTNLLAPVESDPEEEVLCREVTSFNLRYYDGASWLDTWDASTQEGALPLAVEVTLAVRGEDSSEGEPRTEALTRVFMLPCGGPTGSSSGGASGPNGREGG